MPASFPVHNIASGRGALRRRENNFHMTLLPC